MRLPKEDWKKLDDLLSKIGFGGYYDLLEILKIGAFRLCKDKLKDREERKMWETTIMEEKDLKMLVLLINRLILRVEV